MEFCSQYGYNYGFEGSENEELSDDDSVSDSDGTHAKFKIRKADTNILAVKFDDLILSVDMLNYIPIACKLCGAYMSHLSDKSIEKIFDTVLWICEFCSSTNDVTTQYKDSESLMKLKDVTYLLETKAVNNSVNETDYLQNGIINANYLLFCIDVSRSMSSLIPVKRNEDILVMTDDESDSLRSQSESNFSELLRLNDDSFYSSSSHMQHSDINSLSSSPHIIDIDNDIIIKATPSDVDLVNDEEKKFDNDLQTIQNRLKELEKFETKANSQEKQNLLRQFEEVNLKKKTLEEQRKFFEESLKLQDDQRAHQLDAQFSLCSAATINNVNIEDNSVTTITRLEGVKMACIESLKHLKEHEPNIHVAFVLFSDEVRYYADSTQSLLNEPLLKITQENDLKDVNKLLAYAKLCESIKPISETSTNFEAILNQLNAEGGTALGKSEFNIRTLSSFLSLFLL